MACMCSQLETYQEMDALSAQMVEAARQHDWEHLVTLEQRVSALREALRGQDGAAAVTPAEVEVKAVLIQRILDNDAEIRRHTEPWMEHVRQFLGDGVRKRQVDKAYGAGQF